ncbi:hypothetical protein [Deinococcus ruber]|uniref:Uncharacterized protein n=1 Tax=Deinococcus ruber TaxID=1848197 RepID=A0A918CM25_9DEIO|nr:hypothetical protein [Deinococcus ruber]GGR28156.1 hypothetical protein GCM10008957_44220 [Deinococcus ruber]
MTQAATNNTNLSPLPHSSKPALSKVPQVALLFWLFKIAATTLGETGGDALSQQLNLG